MPVPASIKCVIAIVALAVSLAPLSAQTKAGITNLSPEQSSIAHAYEYVYQLENAREKLISSAGNRPTENSLQEQLGLPDEAFQSFARAAQKFHERQVSMQKRVQEIVRHDRPDEAVPNGLSHEAADDIQVLSVDLDAEVLAALDELRAKLGAETYYKLAANVTRLVTRSSATRGGQMLSVSVAGAEGAAQPSQQELKSINGVPHALFAGPGGGGTDTGVGPTCANAPVGSSCSTCDVTLPSYFSVDCGLGGGGPITIEQPPETGGGSSMGDNTPTLEGIDPSVWLSGATTQVTFSGEYFGTNPPTLRFDPPDGISATVVNFDDSTIVANINVAPGTPTEDVRVSITNNGYGNMAFDGSTGNSPTAQPVSAMVQAPTNTSEITVIGWVNSNAPDIQGALAAGPATSGLLNLNGGATSCLTILTSWWQGISMFINGPQDRAYANAWLLKYSGNLQPPPSINPSLQYAAGQFRVFNDFGHGRGGYKLGETPFPCPTNYPDWFSKAGEPSQYMGTSGTVNGDTYLLAEGRLGSAGQTINKAINLTTTPWIWSVVEFDSAGDPIWTDRSMFPSFSIYVNGSLVEQDTQCPAAQFISLDETYQRTPNQIQ